MVDKETADSALATTLKALASASRLALLKQLRRPCILSDIRLVSAEDGPHADRDRPMARQAVRKHLGKLMEAGVVSAHTTERVFGETLEYVVNHPRIFAISEEIRELANLRPVEDLTVAEPTVEDARRSVPDANYPRLLMVRGLKEGAGFRLQPAANASEDYWIVGRKRGVAVPVDYDPYVSLENTRIRWQRGEYHVEDLPQSRNGTTLNFEPVPPGSSAPLNHGDVVGVGRTLFVFQTHAGTPGVPS